MTTDPGGIITDANKRTEALTGCTRDALIGAPFKNYLTDPERAEAGIRQALSGSKVTDYELTARHWTARKRWSLTTRPRFMIATGSCKAYSRRRATSRIARALNVNCKKIIGNGESQNRSRKGQPRVNRIS
jgi:PAS domain-containing protein